MSSNDRVIILDATQRDGEPSPDASMPKEGRLHIARVLERLRVDVIEAGPGDFEAAKARINTWSLLQVAVQKAHPQVADV